MHIVPDESSPIIVEDESLRHGFTQLPNAILRDPTITLGGKIAYAMLLSYAWDKDSCFPGQERMATDMGVSRRSAIIFLQSLQRRGLISIKRRGMGKTNVYTIHHLRSEESAPLDVQNTSQLEVQNLPTKNTQMKEDEKKKMKSGTRVPRAAASGSPSPTPPIEKVSIGTPVAMSDQMIREREEAERRIAGLRARTLSPKEQAKRLGGKTIRAR
jgi:hypothetical protein